MAAAVVAVALVALYGLMTGRAVFSGWLPVSHDIGYGGCIAFVFGGLSLWSWTRRPLTAGRRMLARGLAMVVLLIALGAGVYLISLYVAKGMEGVAAGAFRAHPRRMPPFTVLALIFFGLALLRPERISSRRQRPSEYLALGGVLLGFITVLTHLYHFTYGGESLGAMMSSFPAAMLMLLLGAGVISLHPTGLVGTMLANRGIAGYLTRRIFLLLLLSPPILGGLRHIGLRRGWYDDALGTALSVGAYAVICGGVVFAFGYKLYLLEKHRRSGERRLLSREFDAQVAFNNAPVGIGQLNANYHWVRINSQLPAIFGYTREEFLGLRLKELVQPEHQEQCAAQLRRVMSGEIAHYTEEGVFIRKDGGRIWCNLTITMPADTRLGRRYAIVVMEEVTERKNAELEIVRQKAAAEAANRAKDRFISVISHELRTPLTPVLAMLSAYPRERLTEEQTRVLKMMRRNIEHEVCLIDDLLEVTRLSHGKLRLKKAPVDLHKLLGDIFETAVNSFREKRLRGVLELNAERHNVMGDRARLRQIFINLLDNAKKFTPPEGTITLSTAQRDGEIEVKVSDTGNGIPKASMERIFEAFEQGENARTRQPGGLGLGLAICKGLVEGHQGKISVFSEGPSRGATFTVTLDTIDEEERGYDHIPLPDGRVATILLVEDHADTRMTLQMLLERRGHRVFSAAGMVEALEIAERESPELLLTDIGLPDGDGLELRGMIRERCGLELPAIALSGFASDEDRMATTEAGYARHLVKPINIRVLEATIREVLAG